MSLTRKKQRFSFLDGALFLLLIFIPAGALCGTAENLFLEANSNYEKGNFAEAEKLYRTIVEYGIQNSAVFYNLGNAYFKQDQLGEAILSYEKSLRLNPHDREAQQNLQLANHLIYDRVEKEELSPPLQFALWLHTLFSLNTQLIVAIILFYLSSFLFASLIVRKRRGLSTDLPILLLSVLLFFLVLFSISGAVKIHDLEKVSYGIILTEKVDVLSGPGDSNAVLFPAHEGLKVRVRAGRDAWYQISLPNGLSGWIRKENIGII